jgi:hypothetical protein
MENSVEKMKTDQGPGSREQVSQARLFGVRAFCACLLRRAFCYVCGSIASRGITIAMFAVEMSAVASACSQSDADDTTL